MGAPEVLEVPSSWRIMTGPGLVCPVLQVLLFPLAAGGLDVFKTNQIGLLSPSFQRKGPGEEEAGKSLKARRDKLFWADWMFPRTGLRARTLFC